MALLPVCAPLALAPGSLKLFFPPPLHPTPILSCPAQSVPKQEVIRRWRLGDWIPSCNLRW